ncbi:cutinase-domain-containing protein [Kalaharituber pfeilii]|nr:cutinase-domain-containing protein [Kalaharituber pfeilii]
MKSFSTVLLLTLSSSLALAAPSATTYSAVTQHTEEEILTAARSSPVYTALEEAFRDATKASVEARQSSTTRNDLENGLCAPNIIIHARGTFEEGNMGSGVGVPLIAAVDAELGSGKAIYQGVNNYPADVAGYLIGGSRTGAQNMADQVARAASQCPGSRVFLSGYSQGAQVAHLAAASIPVSLYSVVAGFIFFGDPYEGDPLPGVLNNNVLTICNDGDLICDGLPLPIGSHLDYAKTTPRAAQWIKERAL